VADCRTIGGSLCLSDELTDDYGYDTLSGKVPVVDWHATVLHLLGLDYEKLIYKHAGRDFRLTDTQGRVVREILA